MSSNAAPDPTTTAVGHIMSLDEENFARIVAALSSTVFSSEDDVEEAVQAAVPDLNSEQVAAIVGFSLAFGAASGRVSRPDRFYQSVAERAADKLQVERPAVVDRIARLFAVEGLALAAVAQANLRDNVGALQRSVITTDLRPVLLRNDSTPRLYSVVHRLRLDYGDTGELDRTVEVVLDHEDLEALIKRAQAALQQQRALQATVAGFGARTWFPIDEEESE